MFLQMSSDPNGSPSSSSFVDFFPPSPDPRRDPDIRLSSSSVCTSNSCSTSPLSRFPPLFTAIHVEDQGMRGGAQGEKATPGEFITSSPSPPKSSTVGGDVPITVHPDDVLNNLLNGTNF